MKKLPAFLEEHEFKKTKKGYDAPKKVSFKFKDFLSLALEDVLKHNSSLYQAMVERGVVFDLKEAIKLPNELVGKFSEFFELYEKDMS